MDGKLARDFGLMKYVDELRRYDHAFLTAEGATYFSKPFGFTARTYRGTRRSDGASRG